MSDSASQTVFLPWLIEYFFLGNWPPCVTEFDQFLLSKWDAQNWMVLKKGNFEPVQRYFAPWILGRLYINMSKSSLNYTYIGTVYIYMLYGRLLHASLRCNGLGGSAIRDPRGTPDIPHMNASQGCKSVVLCSHLGRPDGSAVEKCATKTTEFFSAGWDERESMARYPWITWRPP